MRRCAMAACGSPRRPGLSRGRFPSATHLRPGEVEDQGAPMTGLLPVGRYAAGADETARQVAAGLAGSTFLAPVRQDVMRWKYGKLLTNLANAVEAVCGPAGAENGNAAGAAELRRRAGRSGQPCSTRQASRIRTRQSWPSYAAIRCGSRRWAGRAAPEGHPGRA